MIKYILYLKLNCFNDGNDSNTEKLNFSTNRMTIKVQNTKGFHRSYSHVIQNL